MECSSCIVDEVKNHRDRFPYQKDDEIENRIEVNFDYKNENNVYEKINNVIGKFNKREWYFRDCIPISYVNGHYREHHPAYAHGI